MTFDSTENAEIVMDMALDLGSNRAAIEPNPFADKVEGELSGDFEMASQSVITEQEEQALPLSTNGHETNGHVNGLTNGSNGRKKAPYEGRLMDDGEGDTKSFVPVPTGKKPKSGQGIEVKRRLTQPGQDPFETVEWDKRTAAITGEDGRSVFEQTDCEIPRTWSQLATNVVVSKYFRGPLNTPRRETSVRQVIG